MQSMTRQEEQILLAVHKLGQQAYLVSIRELLKKLTGVSLDVGTIYVPLRRLVKKGWLYTRLGEPTTIRGGKAVQYYGLTNLGYQALTESRQIQEKFWMDVIIPSRS